MNIKTFLLVGSLQLDNSREKLEEKEVGRERLERSWRSLSLGLLVLYCAVSQFGWGFCATLR